jgi:hypothetical protein
LLRIVECGERVVSEGVETDLEPRSAKQANIGFSEADVLGIWSGGMAQPSRYRVSLVRRHRRDRRCELGQRRLSAFNLPTERDVCDICGTAGRTLKAFPPERKRCV